jgi:hypothetical protein
LPELPLLLVRRDRRGTILQLPAVVAELRVIRAVDLVPLRVGAADDRDSREPLGSRHTVAWWRLADHVT